MKNYSARKGLVDVAFRLMLATGIAVVVPVALLTHPASAQAQLNQMGTSFDCSRTEPNVPSLVCQTPELRLADLLQMQPYYTLRHAQPERQQELRGQFTTRIQELVRECSTEQVRAGGNQSACVARALGGLRTFWLQQIERISNAAALDEARLPPGHFTGSQQALKALDFLPAEAVVDGVFGSGSRQAIARFQAEKGLPANGFLTAATADALRISANAPPPPTMIPSPAGISVVLNNARQNMNSNCDLFFEFTNRTGLNVTSAYASAILKNNSGRIMSSHAIIITFAGRDVATVSHNNDVNCRDIDRLDIVFNTVFVDGFMRSDLALVANKGSRSSLVSYINMVGSATQASSPTAGATNIVTSAPIPTAPAPAPAPATRPTIAELPPARFSAQMRFTAIPPQQPAFMFGNAWTIIAEGVIDIGAPSRLRALIRSNNIPDRSHIYFNSPGGSFLAALELGRALRDERIYAHLSGDQPSRQAQPPICLSACALAFIGAPFRFGSFRVGETFGVHRFHSQGAEIGDDVTQVLADQIVQYIREMGVDVRLFAEIVRAGRNDINILSRAKLEELGVVNNGVGRTVWSLEGLQGGLYLKGERDTSAGINKFILHCERRRWMLMAIFDPQGRWEEIQAMGAHSVLIDGDPQPISYQPSTSRIRLVNGWVNILNPIDQPMLERIARSRTVGFATQSFHGAPIFLGFDGMEFEGGRERLSGFRRTCGD